MAKERHGKNQITVPVADIIKKDALLSLYGSMPPKEAAPQNDWIEIREKARSEQWSAKWTIC